MSSIRSNDATLEWDGPEAAASVVNGDYAADKLPIKMEGLTDGVVQQVLPDGSWTSDLGDNRPVQGLAEGSLSFNTPLLGQGTAAGDGDQAAETPLGRVIAACFGQAQERSTGDVTTATSHTTIAVTETNAGRHDENQLALFQVGSAFYMRPIWSRASGLLNLGIALPAAPDSAGGELIYGAENIQWSDDPAYTIQGRKIYEEARLDRQYLGCVTELSQGEVGEGEIPLLSVTASPSEFSKGTAYSQTAASKQRPNIVSGGEFLIAKHGTGAAYDAIDYVRPSITTRRGWQRCPAPNNANGADATFPWQTIKQSNGPAEIVIHVSPSSTPPAACDASRWESMVDDQGENDLLQILFSYTRGGPGNSFGWWARYLMLVGWSMVDVAGISAQRLVFGVETGYSAPPLVAATS